MCLFSFCSQGIRFVICSKVSFLLDFLKNCREFRKKILKQSTAGRKNPRLFMYRCERFEAFLLTHNNSESKHENRNYNLKMYTLYPIKVNNMKNCQLRKL